MGQSASIKHTITEADVKNFMHLSGDMNPIHFDRAESAKFNLGEPIVYGMLGGAFISQVIGNKLPGRGALWLSQTLDFVNSVRIGENIEITVQIIAILENENILKLKTEILNQQNMIVTKGFAMVKILHQKVDNLNKQKKINKKVAIVVGANGGLGNAITRDLFQSGFNLNLVYQKNNFQINEFLRQNSSQEQKLMSSRLENLTEKLVENVVNDTKEKFGTITDIVFCAAKSLNLKSFQNQDWSDFESEIEMQIKLPYLFIQKLLPIFKENLSGNIIFLGSQIVKNSKPRWLNYATAKSALRGFATNLAVEFGGFNIRVNIVHPNLIETPLTFGFSEKEKIAAKSRNALNKLTEAADVSKFVAFLASDESKNISGQEFFI